MSESVPMRTARFPDRRPFYGIKSDVLKGLEELVTARIVVQGGDRCVIATTLPESEKRLLVVVDGAVEILAPGAGTNFCCVARLETGDLGDLFFFGDVRGLELRASCSATRHEQGMEFRVPRSGTVLVFDRESFYRTAAQDPDAARWVMQWLGVGRCREQLHAYRMATLDVEEAVMADLRRIAIRRDRISDQDMMAAHTTQLEVAQRIMHGRETVSRAMAKLVRKGLLIRRQNGLYLIRSA